MPFAGHTFTGRLSLDAFWAHKPGTFEYLPEPWAVAARWCECCWRLIPNGDKAFWYGGFDLCLTCHLRYGH